MQEEQKTFLDLLIGIAFWGIVIGIIGSIITGQSIRFGLGTAYGMAVAALISYHLYSCLEKTMDYGAKGAKRYVWSMSLLRMGILAIAVIIAFFLSKYMHPAGVILGILTLKFSAYLQPVIRKVVTYRIYNKGR